MSRSGSLPWFKRWVPSLQKHVRVPWPPRADEEFWASVEAALADNWASEAEGDAILSRLARTVQFNNQLPREIEIALKGHRAIQNASGPANGPLPGSREEAEQRSAGCPDCGGSEGYAHRELTIRELHTDEPRPTVYRFAMPCVCPVGRWVAGRLREGKVGFFDLAECRALWLDTEHPSWPADRDGEWSGGLPIMRLRNGTKVEIVGCVEPVRSTRLSGRFAVVGAENNDTF